MTFRPRHISEEDFKVFENRVRGGVVALGKGGVSHVTTHKRELRSQVGNLATSPYKNKWEESYAYVCTMEKHAGLIKDWAYETMTIRLAKGKYHRTDFTVWHLDNSIELAQVKGYHKNIRASLTALKWAAKQNPWFRFTLKRRVNGGWETETVNV